MLLILSPNHKGKQGVIFKETILTVHPVITMPRV